MSEATALAEAGRLALADMAEWKVTATAAEGSPGREILAFADEFAPDLIVLGEPASARTHEHRFLGQTSQIVLTEADCTVRIARPSKPAGKHERILVGFNGSPAAFNVIDALVSRNWPAGTEVMLLAVADSSVLATIGRFTPQMTDATVESRFALQWAETLADGALLKLERAGLRSRLAVKFGHPKDVLAHEAAAWEASSIFVGPHCALNSYERFLIGSVSASLAAQASCSVEVVRPQ
jgi:nucleotide-binding universal stress UspA family protein